MGTNVPKEEREVLVCLSCKRELPHERFYKEGRSKSGLQRYSARCRDCYGAHAATQEYNIKRKEKFLERVAEVEALISHSKQKCAVCGYDRCKNALDFHHKHPNEKLFEICDVRWQKSASRVSIDQLILELQKCIVLCSNCHREYHAGVLDVSGIPTIKVNRSLKN